MVCSVGEGLDSFDAEGTRILYTGGNGLRGFSEPSILCLVSYIPR